MGYFPVRYDSRVVIYERKMIIRLATGLLSTHCLDCKILTYVGTSLYMSELYEFLLHFIDF